MCRGDFFFIFIKQLPYIRMPPPFFKTLTLLLLVNYHFHFVHWCSACLWMCHCPPPLISLSLSVSLSSSFSVCPELLPVFGSSLLTDCSSSWHRDSVRVTQATHPVHDTKGLTHTCYANAHRHPHLQYHTTQLILPRLSGNTFWLKVALTHTHIHIHKHTHT